MTEANDYLTLRERLQKVMQRHIEKQHGIISAPDRLLDNLLTAVSEWLQHDESNWGDCEGVVSEALRDLRTNQMR